MTNKQDAGSTPKPSSRTSYSPDLGPLTDPNPGERSAQADSLRAPLNSLGVIPARGNRAGGGQQIDLGAQVGIMRSMEFTAGGRAHRLITGTFGPARPTMDPKSGILHVSAASDTGGSPAVAIPTTSQRASSQPVPGTGAVSDTSTGDTSPARRRDTKAT